MESNSPSPKSMLYEKLSECADLLSKLAEESDLNEGDSSAKKFINVGELRRLASNAHR